MPSRPFDKSPETWARLSAEQARLSDDTRRVQQYGADHPEDWAGFRFHNDDPVRIVATFTDHLEHHEKALRLVLDHPDLLDVEYHPYSANQQERIRDELKEEMFSSGRTLATGLSSKEGRVCIQLRATAEELAHLLHERYGDVLRITVGALRYPDRQPIGSSSTPQPTITVPGLELRLLLDRESVPSGDDAIGRIVIRNHGAALIDMETGEPMLGSTLDSNQQLVGMSAGGYYVGVGRHLQLEPGETSSVSAVAGTASCSSEIGYLLPSGRYLAVVPLKVYGPLRLVGAKPGVLVPPPAPLVLT